MPSEENPLVCHLRSHAFDGQRERLIGSEACGLRDDEAEVHLADDVPESDLFGAPGVTRCAVCFA